VALGAVAVTHYPAGSGWTAPRQPTLRSPTKALGFGPLGSPAATQLGCVHGHVHLLYVLQRFHVRDLIPYLHPRTTENADDDALKGGVDDAKTRGSQLLYCPTLQPRSRLDDLLLLQEEGTPTLNLCFAPLPFRSRLRHPDHPRVCSHRCIKEDRLVMLYVPHMHMYMGVNVSSSSGKMRVVDSIAPTMIVSHSQWKRDGPERRRIKQSVG
jgi:hypothetical protein